MTQPVVPTLYHVAQLAGVSENTVSRVMRDKGSIAPDTRQRVLQAVQTLGYVPNRAAGSLASSGSLLVGVLLPSLSNVVFPELLEGVQTALRETPYQAMIGVTDYDVAREEEILSSLLAWRPVAVVTTGFDHTAPTHAMLQASGIRVAEVMEIDGDPVDVAVGFSHRRAGYDSARFLIERGYRRIAYIGHDWQSDRRAHSRYEGLRMALAEAGLPLIAEERTAGPSSTAAGSAMLAKMIQCQSKPDAIAFSNDDMAIGGVFHCLSAGIRIREELALFGFNGLEIGQSLPLPLSTVRSNRFDIGRRAVETLMQQRERPKAPTVIDTGYEIVVGATA